MRRIAELFAQALTASRTAARVHGMEEAARLCDALATSGAPEHILGASECASIIRDAVRIARRPD